MDNIYVKVAITRIVDSSTKPAILVFDQGERADP